jgi:Leucine-rich repeat (LRR) protein
MDPLFRRKSKEEEEKISQGSRWQQCAKLIEHSEAIILYLTNDEGMNMKKIYIFKYLRCNLVNEWKDLGTVIVHLHCITGDHINTIIFPKFKSHNSNCNDRESYVYDPMFLYNTHFSCQTKKVTNITANSEINLECQDPDKFLEYPPYLGTYYKDVQFLFLSSPSYLDVDMVWMLNTLNLPCPYYCHCFMSRCFHLQIRCGTTLWIKKPDLDSFFRGIVSLKPYLTTIEITYSHLERVPMKICRTETVENLILSNNIIQEIPTCLSELPSLKQIDLSYNKVRSLHLEKIKKLKYLFIHHNKIRRIRKTAFSYGGNFQELDISYNRIKSIDQHALQGLHNLRIVNLSFNEIEMLDFFLPKKIEIIELSDNNITKVLATIITPLKILQHLNLADNKIEKLDHYIFLKNKELLVLKLSNNILKRVDFVMPQKIEEIYLDGNQIEVLSNDVFQNVKNLKKLILSNNKIKKINKRMVMRSGDLTTITELKLDGNLFVSIDDIKFPLKNVQHLDMSHNRLVTIDLEIFTNSSLKTLNLHNNTIKDIKTIQTDKMMDEIYMRNIEVLNVSYNRLNTAPLNVIVWSEHLKQLDISNNNIQNATWGLDSIDESSPLGKFRRWLNAIVCKQRLYSKKTSNLYSHIKETLRQVTHIEPTQASIIPVTNLEHNNITLLENIFNEPSLFSPPDASLLYYFKFSNNPIKCDCSIYPYLIQIHQLLLKWDEALSEIRDPVRPPPCHHPAYLRSVNLSDTQVLERVLKQLHCDYRVEVGNRNDGSCQYLFYPYNDTLIIGCTNQKMKEIPPILNDTFYHPVHKKMFKPENKILLLSGNNITNLNAFSVDHQDSFTFFDPSHSFIDLSHSNISSIDDNTWLMLFIKVSHLFLNDNNLTHLPLKPNLKFTDDTSQSVPVPANLKELHLYNNPWNCSCDQNWMKSWLLFYINTGVIIKPHLVTCASPSWNRGKVIHGLPQENFCSNPNERQIRATVRYVFIVLFICVLLGILKELLYKNKYKLFEFKLHPFDSDECYGENMNYDVFISYCENEQQSKSLKTLIRTRLDPPYKICDPDDRNAFPLGRPVQDSLADAIIKSKRTIIILTKAYVSDRYCCEDFNTALAHWSAEERQHRLIVIKDIFMNTDDIADDRLKQYLREYTYLELDENFWWRLSYILPQIPIPHCERDDMLIDI